MSGKKRSLGVLAVFAAVLAWTGAQVWSQAPSLGARVIAVTGQPQFRPASSSGWSPLYKGSRLQEGAEVLTDADSRCEILILRSVIRLQPGSNAVLSSFDPVKIDLKSGKIFSLVAGLETGSKFEVSTPTAIASARGTGWDQTASEVQVFEDTVHVTGQGGGEMDVDSGKGLEINEDGTLGDVFDLGEDASGDWEGFKQEAASNAAGTSGGEEGSEGGASGEGEASDPGRLDEILDSSESHEDAMDAKTDNVESDDLDDIADQLKPEKEGGGGGSTMGGY